MAIKSREMMGRSQERLDHALHNEGACLHLFSASKFNDWVITTAYYSANHFFRYKLFPGHVKYYKSRNHAIDYSTFCSSIGENTNHKILKELVKQNCAKDSSRRFKKLLDLCWTARYNNYKSTKVQCNYAVESLQIIKKYCTG